MHIVISKVMEETFENWSFKARNVSFLSSEKQD